MYEFVSAVVTFLKKFIPEPVVALLRKPYHAALAPLLAASYGFPANKLVIIGVTGTKGKSSVCEMLFAIFSAAGYKVALASTIRFAIGTDSKPNRFKMTVPGRGFLQAFLKRSLDAGCTHVILEVTSEAVLQYRHWFLALDGLVVTNIQKEHIESHGSFERYVAAKRKIVTALEKSRKPKRVLVTNEDIAETRAFLSANVPTAIGFGERELTNLSTNEGRVSFEYRGERFVIPLPGKFNALNALAAAKLGAAFDIPLQNCARALGTVDHIPGRAEKIDAGQDFLVVVDYAHTPDSLQALYDAFPARKKICVLGNTGGGRDVWKRPLMGKIADEACEKVILTNEDPYDEDPASIADAMARGMARAPEIVMDRREAIRAALRAARPGDAVLITGKGTDPFIMGAKGAKTPWSDAAVAREELEKLKS